MPLRILKLWLRWRKDWDSLCTRCGKCCYSRRVDDSGTLIIDYRAPCENLDTQTHLCRVYDHRFRSCDHCGKVGLYTALFNPTLPKDCAYVQTFRLWEKEREQP